MWPADERHAPTPEEVMEYLDGEGEVASRIAIQTHLVTCTICQALAADHHRLTEAVMAWEIDVAPASFQAPDVRRAPWLPICLPAWWRSRFVLGVVGAAAVLVMIAVSARDRRAAPAAVAADAAFLPMPNDSMASISGADPQQFRSVLGGTEIQRAAQGTALTRQGQPTAPGAERPLALRRPDVIRTATLRVVAADFDGVRPAIQGIVSAAGGFVDQLTATDGAGTARAVRGTLRIPADRLADVSDQLRRLGQVVEDTQGSEDVADQVVDLAARLTSARATEQRLMELLRQRTAKLSHVLDVERELARVRVDIERLTAEQSRLGQRISYATLRIEIVEERKAGFAPGPLSLGSRIRVASADGLESAIESLADSLLLVLRAGPTLALWAAVLGVAWLVLRQARRLTTRASRLE
jgi:hypothetical protein